MTGAVKPATITLCTRVRNPPKMNKEQLAWWNRTLLEILRIWDGPPPSPGSNKRIEDSRARERRNHFMYGAHSPATWEALLRRLNRHHPKTVKSGSVGDAFTRLVAMKNAAELLGKGVNLVEAAEALALYIKVSKDPELRQSREEYDIMASSIHKAYMKWKRDGGPAQPGRPC